MDTWNCEHGYYQGRGCPDCDVPSYLPAVLPLVKERKQVTHEDATYVQILEQARAAGADHGRSAASWYFDGNTSDETYAAVLKGIEDGDPEIMDTFPSSPLSGKWADEPTPASVLAELDVEEDDDASDDYLSAYEDGFYTASAQEIERVARYHSV